MTRASTAPTVRINTGGSGATSPFTVTSGIPREQLAKEVAARSWYHTFDFGGGIVAHGPDPSHHRTQYLGFPDHLAGLSVLDVGAWDGHYSFEAARRGARDVLATDEFVWTRPGHSGRGNFEFVRKHLGLPVRDQVISVEKLSPEAIGGTFDVTLFYGVLYHAPDPLGYLKLIRRVTNKYVLIETVVDLLDVPCPALAYYPGDSLNGDTSNHFGPNMLALEGLLRDAGYSKMDDLGVWRLHEIERIRGRTLRDGIWYDVPPEALPTGAPTSGRAVVRAWV